MNEFVSALVEDRDPRPSAVTSANWTCVGLCAHASAQQGGAIVRLPDFTLEWWGSSVVQRAGPGSIR